MGMMNTFILCLEDNYVPIYVLPFNVYFLW